MFTRTSSFKNLEKGEEEEEEEDGFRAGTGAVECPGEGHSVEDCALVKWGVLDGF